MMKFDLQKIEQGSEKLTVSGSSIRKDILAMRQN